MENAKNANLIKTAENIKQDIVVVRKKAEGSFNNREFSLVITKLQEAELWASQYVVKLNES